MKKSDTTSVPAFTEGMPKTIADIKAFWDAHPLLYGELDSSPGSAQFIRDFDRIKKEDVFAGDITDWIFPRMQGKKVLDVGCGPGYWSRRVNELGGEYYGVDLSSTSVEMTRSSLSLFKQNGTIVEGNAENLPFPSEGFDFVISEGVIHHTVDTDKCIREIHRVLKPGGEAMISVYYKNAFLRKPWLFRVLKLTLKIAGVGLRGRGREAMHSAPSAEEFVRMYDGAENPIGRMFGRQEFLEKFENYNVMKTKIYYLPMRAVKLRMPEFIRALLMPLLGTMIFVHARKRQ